MSTLRQGEIVDVEPGIAAETPPRGGRDDIVAGLLWMALGLVVFVASWRMDRLEAQDINPYTIPGLLPGLLGLAMMAFAGLMLLRGWRNGGLGQADAATGPAPAWGRLVLVLALCVGFAAGLLGRVPFWLAASIYVAVSILVLRYAELRAAGRLGNGLVTALLVGLGSGVVVTLVFERLFLVRLP